MRRTMSEKPSSRWSRSSPVILTTIKTPRSPWRKSDASNRRATLSTRSPSFKASRFPKPLPRSSPNGCGAIRNAPPSSWNTSRLAGTICRMSSIYWRRYTTTTNRHGTNSSPSCSPSPLYGIRRAPPCTARSAKTTSRQTIRTSRTAMTFSNISTAPTAAPSPSAA